VSGIEKRIEEVLRAHHDDGQSHYDPFTARTYRVCVCGHRSRNFQAHEEHVATAVVEALALQQEWSNTANGTNRMRLSAPRQVDGCDLETRWVTSWETL
jgi:hypothetical protein